MGSFQQICLGTICLVAAYLFGNYVNNNPPLTPDSGNLFSVASESQTANGLAASLPNPGSTTGNIQSRLPLSDLTPVESKPAPIVTMRTPLKSRFTVPSPETAPQESVYESPTIKQLPPPSQLAETIETPTAAFTSKPFSSPFAEPLAVSPTIQVPDFSSIAAEFKNTPIELPNMSRLGGMPSHSNQPDLNQFDQFGNYRNSSLRNSNPPNGRLKQLVQRLPNNEFQNPNLPNGLTEDPMPNQLRQRQVKPQRQFAPPKGTNELNKGFSQADFEPKLNDNIFGLKSQPNRYEDLPDHNDKRLQAVSNAHVGNYQYDVPPPVPPGFNAPKEQTSSGFRGNLTFRPELENRSRNHNNGYIESEPDQFEYRDQRPTAPVVGRRSSRLPFRLNNQAKTELVQIRDRADSMTGSDSTRFVDHTIMDGETLQSISERYFGSPVYYLDIYLANRNKMRNPADTQTGVSIRVPIYQSP